MTVNSTSNLMKDGPSGVRINQESVPSGEGRGAGKGRHRLLVMELDNHTHQEIVQT